MLRVPTVTKSTARLGARSHGETNMLGTILLIVLILLLIGAIPRWPYSRGWGYGPSGITGLILIVVLVLLFTHQI